MNFWSTIGRIALVTVIFGKVVAAHSKSDLAPALDLFQDEWIPKLRITVAQPELDRLRQQQRRYVPATVQEGNTTYTNVSIRLKGGPGSFRPLSDKPAFTLNFGRLAKGQKFHGLKKLHLNNSVQDRTFLGEKISRELFLAADVPAPRAGHACVELNGRNLGFYVLIEGIDNAFLRRSFGNSQGNLYDGHSQSDVNRRMRTNSGESRTNQMRLRALATAALEPDLDQRSKRLEETLDVDRFLSFLATEVMLCHWDGYALNRNNFRVFEDVDHDRLVFLPQGVDQVFQRNTPVFPQMVGLVAKSALEVPELRKKYRDRMAQLLTNVWKVDVLTNHLYEVAAKVQTSLASTDEQDAAAYMSRVANFSRRIERRIRVLRRELQPPANTDAALDPTGLLLLTGWRPQTDIGDPVLQKDEQDPNRPLLSIVAEDSCAASWRCTVVLDEGRYHFEGRLRLEGVKFGDRDPKTGAGLRISRSRFAKKLTADCPWTPVTFEFEVQQAQTPVELVCELRASEGKAWFDQRSLRLRRLE